MQDAHAFALELASQQLDRLRAHEAGARSGEDHEELHDLRVALRRLRTIARVFDSVLPPSFAALQLEMRWLDDVLGGVRDLDVQLELLHAGPGKPQPGVVQELEQQRERARRELLEALSGPRYRRLVIELEESTRAALPIADGPDIRELAPAVLKSVYKRYHRKARRLSASATSVELHEVRRRARRLRYTSEFLRELYGAPAKRMIRAVEAAQDVLGNYQDCVTSIDKLCEMPPTPGGETVALIQARRAQMRELRAELPPALQRVKHAWRELRPHLQAAKRRP